MDAIWIVSHPDCEHTTEVSAETWWVTDNGDLLFGAKPEPVTRQGVVVVLPPVPSHGFAAGTWSEVNRYA